MKHHHFQSIPGWEETLMISDHLVQAFLAKSSLDMMAQHPVQLNLTGVCHWGIHHCPGEIFHNNSQLVE